MRIAAILAIVIAAFGLALWAFSAPADISFQYGNWEGETSRVALFIVLALLGAAIAVFWCVLAWLFKLPFALTRTARRAHSGKAKRALSDGLIAAEGGDAGSASKSAKRAEHLAQTDPAERKLTLLLQARAAEANKEWSEAEHAYSDLSREKGAELAGLRGLAAAAVQRGDYHGAETHARKALELKTKAKWPFSTLFELQTKSGDWNGANDTLLIGEKRGFIDMESARRRRAVLTTAEADRQRLNDAETAEKLALDATRIAPSFPPAALLAARLQMAAGKTGKAVSTIEGAWRIRPHPALALLWRDLKPGETEDVRANRLEKLAEVNPTHRESRILLVEAAIGKQQWLKASEILTALMDQGVTTRLASLMEAVCVGQEDHEGSARWSRAASASAREPDWSDIDPDGRAFDYGLEDWGRLAYAFGDNNTLIHPRHETYGGELGATAHLALPAPKSPSNAIDQAAPENKDSTVT